MAHEGLATYPFVRETSGPAKGKQDDRIDQVPDRLKRWMEEVCLGIRNEPAEDDTDAFRTNCWFAESAVILLARYFSKAIPYRNHVLWGTKWSPT